MRRLLFIIALMPTFTMAQSYKFPIHQFEYTAGQNMAYVDQGNENDQTVLFVHGLGGSIKHWYPTLETLSNEYRCIAIDLPAYGASSPNLLAESDLLDAFAKVIDQFIVSIDLNDVTLVGHSMGAQIATMISIKEPKWLKMLVLAAPAGFETFSDKDKETLTNITTPEVFQAQTEEQIRAAFALNFINQPDWIEEMIQDRLEIRSSEHFETFCQVRSAAVAGMLEHPVRDQLSQISVPTLVIFGKEDRLIPNTYLHPELTVTQVANAYQDIPNATLHMLDSAGHMLQIDNSTAFNEQLRTFMKNQNQ